MKITVLTLFPKMIEGFFEESIIKRAQDKNLVEVEVVNLRDYATDSYKTVDDKPYGGGAGMVLRVDILHNALAKILNSKLSIIKQIPNTQYPIPNTRVILTSAKGKTFNQAKAQEFSKLEHLVLIAGHYEAVDERILNEVDEELSMGDFVMTGGEIATAAVVDSVVRLIPGVLKKDEASVIESFHTYLLDYVITAVGENEILNKLKKTGVKEVQLLEYPHYTRPEEFEGVAVPEVLLSGNHANIGKWRLQKSYEETLKKRPDLLRLTS